MKYKQVLIASVVVPEVRVTAVYDEEHLKLLRETLAAMGQQQPIVVVQVGEELHLVDGLHRLNEARLRGESLIPAVITEGEAQDVLLKNLVLNQVRGRVAPSDMVKVMEILTARYGMDSDAIARATGFSRDYVEQFWRISEAAPGVRQALDEGGIGIGQAYHLARMPRHVQQEEVLATFPVQRWTVKQTKEFVDDVLRQMEAPGVPAAPRPPAAPPRYLCSTCEQEIRPQFLNQAQLCPDCMKGAWEIGRQIKARSAQPAAPAEGIPTP